MTLPIKHDDWTLDDSQQQVVESPLDIAVVEAVAGSGKTRTTVHRIANLIDHGINPSSILLVTFTNAAAKEMKERLYKLVDKEKAKHIVTGTFHAIAMQYVRRYYGDNQFTALTPEEDLLAIRDPILTYISDTMIQSEYAPGTHEYRRQAQTLYRKFDPDKLLQWISTAINTDQSLKDVLKEETKHGKNKRGVTPEELTAIYQRYQAYKKEHHYINFDDMLLLFLELLQRPFEGPSIKEEIQHLLVDEYQDINALQFKLIKELTNQSLLAIGDKAQAIYSWRGSNSDYIAKFEDYFPGATRYTISRNYRSGHNVLQRAQEVINLNRDTYGSIELIAHQTGGSVNYKRFPDEYNQAEAIAKTIKTLNTPRHETAILVRTRGGIPALEQACIKENIQYRIVGGQGFFQHDAVKEILSVLKLVAAPHTPLFYPLFFQLYPETDDNYTLAIRDFLIEHNLDFDLTRETFSGYQKPLSDLRALIEPKEQTPTQIFQTFMERVYEDILKDKHTDALGNRDEVAYADDQEVLGVLIEELNKHDNLPDFLNAIELLDKEPDNTQNAITISTMHAAKGLEWDVVFCPTWVEGRMPILFSDTNLAEETNLAYVSITRAKETLYLSSVRTVRSWKSSEFAKESRFIHQLKDANLIEDTYTKPIKPSPQTENPFQPQKQAIINPFQ